MLVCEGFGGGPTGQASARRVEGRVAGCLKSYGVSRPTRRVISSSRSEERMGGAGGPGEWP